VVLLWRPKQCPELNAADHLWKELKRLIAANRQFRTIDQEADYAERWFLGLSPRQALRKAGILSEDFWLKDFLENFWLPTFTVSVSSVGEGVAAPGICASCSGRGAPPHCAGAVASWSAE
jgi:hypothetical protein